MPDPVCRLDRLHELISRKTDELITAEEHRELAAALESDAEARRQWFVRNDIDVAMITTSAERRDAVLVPDSAGAAGRMLQKRFRGAVPSPLLTGLGVAIGVFGASAVWAVALPRSAFTETVIRVFTDGFEDGLTATIPGLPGGPDDAAGDVWRGDEAHVVTSRQEVAPARGERMLAFRRSTHAGENPTASAWSDVYRFVDARPFLARAARQPVTARLEASFAAARDASAEGESYSASVHVYAFDRDLTTAPSPVPLSWIRDNCVASGMKRMPLVSGRNGWQRVAVDASLPPDTKFVLLHVAVVRDRPAPTSEPATFRGHFVDDVTLELHVRRAAR